MLGADPAKLALRDDLPRVWAAGRRHFEAHPTITGAELYTYVVELAEAAGWRFGGLATAVTWLASSCTR